MTSLTSAVPVAPLLNNPVVAAQGTTAVLNILAARSTDSLSSPLVETLQAAAGPGNIITGTVEEASPDGTVTVATQNGTLITVHHPPELPLEPGTAVVLRLLATTSATQAALLAVNGKPVVLRNQASASTGSSAAPAPQATGAARPASAAAAPSSASVAASFIATISLEDEVAIESAIDQGDLSLSSATAKAGSPDSAGPTVVATLIRPAPAKLGQVPVPSGTRYLVTLREVGSVESVGPIASGRASAGAVSPAPPPAGSTAQAVAAAARAAGGSTPPAAMPELPVSVAATVLLALQDEILNPSPVPGRVVPALSDPPGTPPPEPGAQAMLPAPASPLGPAPAVPQALPPAPVDDDTPIPESAQATPPPEPVPAEPSPTQQTAAPAIPAELQDAPPATTTPTQETPQASPQTTAAPMPPPAPTPAAVPDMAAFSAQVSTLAGRVVAPRMPAETLVETAIGTLALPLPMPLPLGAAVQLRVSAVAPPLTAPHAAAHEAASADAEQSATATPPSLIEELARALAPAGPGAVMAVQQVLTVQPGDGLAAALFVFLTGIRRDAGPRGTDLPGRKALLEVGRKDLADRLDQARSDIGSVRPPHGPDGWTVTILPFLGPASVRPMRLYRKQHQDKDADGRPKGKPSERFMLEIELKRLGPLQFDGLVRERRFDLVLRSRDPFVPALQGLVEHVFQDGLLIAGWGGEIGFGRIGKFPLIPDPESASHLDLGA